MAENKKKSEELVAKVDSDSAQILEPKRRKTMSTELSGNPSTKRDFPPTIRICHQRHVTMAHISYSTHITCVYTTKSLSKWHQIAGMPFQ